MPRLCDSIDFRAIRHRQFGSFTTAEHPTTVDAFKIDRNVIAVQFISFEPTACRVCGSELTDYIVLKFDYGCVDITVRAG